MVWRRREDGKGRRGRAKMGKRAEIGGLFIDNLQTPTHGVGRVPLHWSLPSWITEK